MSSTVDLMRPIVQQPTDGFRAPTRHGVCHGCSLSSPTARSTCGRYPPCCAPRQRRSTAGRMGPCPGGPRSSSILLSLTGSRTRSGMRTCRPTGWSASSGWRRPAGSSSPTGAGARRTPGRPTRRAALRRRRGHGRGAARRVRGSRDRVTAAPLRADGHAAGRMTGGSVGGGRIPAWLPRPVPDGQRTWRTRQDLLPGLPGGGAGWPVPRGAPIGTEIVMLPAFAKEKVTGMVRPE